VALTQSNRTFEAMATPFRVAPSQALLHCIPRVFAHSSARPGKVLRRHSVSTTTSGSCSSTNCHDAVDEGVRNEGFVASALVDLTRRRLSVDDVVDTETKRAGELPAELLAEIKGAQIIPTPRCQNYLRARKRRLATCPKAQAFSIYDRCKARYARY
jgi:hypothetical protein